MATYGNGPHMQAVIAAATATVEPSREPGSGDTVAEPCEVEPHLPHAMSERIIIRHDERSPRR